MAISFNKRELEKKKEKKREEKLKRKEARKASGSSSFEDMIAYVDENGVITDTPPDPVAKEEIEAESIEISIPKKEVTEEDTSLLGTVEFYNSDKGFGFIKRIGAVNKYFFHRSNAPADIAEGNKVTFELERGPKGMNAVNITYADKNDH